MNGADPWKKSAGRAELLAIYARVDALLAGFSCEASTECCRFGVTGREPYVTPPEIAEVQAAVAALGGGRALLKRRPKRLPLAGVDDERACGLLGEDGRCRAYASRPFGCRTFFCERASGPGRFPRDEVQRLGRAIADLAAKVAPADPRARPFTRALKDLIQP